MSLDRINTESLTNIINDCFDLSTNGRINNDERKEFLILGKRLRGNLINLISAKFDTSNAEYKEANDDINKINNSLEDTINDISNCADIIDQIGKLVNICDELLKTAVSFL